jgi:hypothetical protein
VSTTAQPPRKPRRKYRKRPYNPNQPVIATAVTPELKERAFAVAAAAGTTVSAMLREALERKLDGFTLVGATGDGPAAAELTSDAAVEAAERRQE